MQYHTHPHSLYSIELWPCIFKENVSISYGNLNGGEFPDRVQYRQACIESVYQVIAKKFCIISVFSLESDKKI